MRSWMTTFWVQSPAVCLWHSDTSEEAVPHRASLHLRALLSPCPPLSSLSVICENALVCLPTAYQLSSPLPPADPPPTSWSPPPPADPSLLLPLCAPVGACLSVFPSGNASLHHSASMSESTTPPVPCPSDTLLNVRPSGVGSESALRLTVFCR